MRKDYLEVFGENKSQAEINFVEDFWTKRWSKQSIDSQGLERVEKFGEFKIANKYLSGLPKGSKLLNGGCGLDHWTTYYHRLGYQVTGLDLSRQTIKRLKKEFPQEKFVAGDIRKLPFQNNSFDAYFSWGTFEHFEEGLESCISEARRILKPKGLLLITVPYDNFRLRLKESMEMVSKQENGLYRFYQWRLTAREIAKELTMRGFRVESVTPIYKSSGLRRLIKHDLGIDPKNLVHKVLMVLLYPFIPAKLIAHMLMVVAYKK